jgi:hypothetical protein
MEAAMSTKFPIEIRARRSTLAGLGLGYDLDRRKRLSGLRDAEPTLRIEAKRPLGVWDLSGRRSFQPAARALDSLVTAERNNYAAPSSQPDKSRSEPWGWQARWSYSTGMQ